MSYEEKRIWAYLAASAANFGVYLAIVLEHALRGPLSDVRLVSALLWATGASIVASIVVSVLVETASPIVGSVVTEPVAYRRGL